MISGDEDMTAIQSLLETKSETIFVLPYRYAQYFGSMDLLSDLTSEFKEEASLFYPSVWELGMVENAVYGIPWLGHSMCLLYNKTLLEQAGFIMDITSDGEEGYKYFAAHQNEVDLILMDLHMPVMDGYTSSDMIRKINQEIPIVAMTADAIKGVEEKCRSHGIWNYVSKPFEPDQLIETLIAILSGKEAKVPAQHEAERKIAEDVTQVVDFKDGLKRMGGDRTIYRLVLQSFAEENRSVAEQLSGAIRSRDFALGEQIVHKIKSSAGSIGAKNLHDIAVELQCAFKDESESEIISLSATFYECLTRTLSDILMFNERNA